MTKEFGARRPQEEQVVSRERLALLDVDTQQLVAVLRGSNHARGLQELWRYPGVTVEELAQEHAFGKDAGLAEYVELATELQSFRVAVTERRSIHLPNLARLLGAVGGTLDRALERRRPSLAAHRLRPLFSEFLGSDAARPAEEYVRVSALDPDLVFSATRDATEAFIVSDGYLRSYLLAYDTISARAPIIERYLATARAIDQEAPIGAFLFLTKRYGPTGPVKDRHRFAEAFPAAGIITHRCFAPAHAQLDIPAAAQEARRVCIVYDLVYSGDGVLSGAKAVRQAGIGKEGVEAIVLSSEAACDPRVQARFDEAGVRVHELFPYARHRSEYGSPEYGLNWQPLGRPRSTEPPLYEPVVSYFRFLAGMVGLARR